MKMIKKYLAEIVGAHPSQRGWFACYLYEWMKQDSDIWLVVGDLGYKAFDAIRDDFPDRFINVGAAEMSMMGVAVGLALEGKKPFVYSISSFLLWRPAETIRLYVDHESIPVRLVGGGRDKDYHLDGFSHDATDGKQLMRLFKNIKSRWPETKEEIPHWVEKMVKEDGPWYLNLRR